MNAAVPTQDANRESVTRIPVCEPVISEREMANVSECMRTGWISSAGEFIDEFEQRWAGYCGREFGVAVSNGTAALQLAVATLDLQPGDEVILPTFTIMSCAQAVLYNGGVPVLVDSDPHTGCMDVSRIEERITSRTRAIMPVHIYGHPVDMDTVIALADEYGLAIVEDAAEAHGAEYLTDRGKPTATWQRCGGMGTLSTFSFYANKLITTGEGGMVLTDDAVVAERLRSMRNICFGPRDRYRHESLGHNFRLTNLQAAIGVGQIERIDAIVAKKRWIAEQYEARLATCSMLQLPTEQVWAHSVYWMYAVVLSDATGMDAAAFADALKARGVDTRPFFLGMHEQPALQAHRLFAGEHYPVADRLRKQGLYLPSGLSLTELDIDRVASTIREVLR